MKKTEIKVITICFIDDNNETIVQKKITAIPLKESFIIEKSIEFFNDPEPCMIHRSAVMKRIYMQMYDFFLENMEKGKGKLQWDDLPCFMHNALDVPSNIQYIKII